MCGFRFLSYSFPCITSTRRVNFSHLLKCTDFPPKFAFALVQHHCDIQSDSILACVAGVRRGGKGERRAHEAREQTREDRGSSSDWFTVLSVFFVTLYLDHDFTTLIKNRPNV